MKITAFKEIPWLSGKIWLKLRIASFLSSAEVAIMVQTLSRVLNSFYTPNTEGDSQEVSLVSIQTVIV